jgi:hypothetical protein
MGIVDTAANYLLAGRHHGWKEALLFQLIWWCSINVSLKNGAFMSIRRFSHCQKNSSSEVKIISDLLSDQAGSV